jgi:hypothetical protein
MKTNLSAEVEWLRSTIASASSSSSSAWLGFEYAPQYAENMASAVKAGDRRVTFDFETAATKISKNAAVASLSAMGTLELDMFRKADSPYRPTGFFIVAGVVWC